MVKGYIYKFTNKRTNQSYIGKTFNLSLRYKNHIEDRGCTSKFNKALKKYGIPSTSISGCCHGKYRTAGNYKWKLKED